jgi:hypothetical protein
LSVGGSGGWASAGSVSKPMPKRVSKFNRIRMILLLALAPGRERICRWNGAALAS